MFIFSQVSLNEFLITIENMFAIETSHAMGILDKFGLYAKDIVKMAILLSVAHIVPYGVILAVTHRKRDWNKENNRLLANVFFCFIVMGISLYTTIFFEPEWRFYYSVVFVCIIVIGIQYAKKLSGDAFVFYLCCMVVSVLEFFATILLTNMELIVSVPYLLLAAIVSFLPISAAIRENDIDKHIVKLKKGAVVCVMLLLAFRSVYLIRPMWKYMNTIFEIEGITKSGPAIGIMSTYMGPYIQSETIKEWEQYIADDDTIYLIGGRLIHWDICMQIQI